MSADRLCRARARWPFALKPSFSCASHSVPSSSSSWGQPGQRRACQIFSAAETPSGLGWPYRAEKPPVVVVDRGLRRRLGFEEELPFPAAIAPGKCG